MKRRLLAPEVIQTSAMDCGPAALKCVLDNEAVAVVIVGMKSVAQVEEDLSLEN